MERQRRKHREVLRNHLSLAGQRIADVGCGDGALARLMAKGGARVIGIECSQVQLDRAQAAEKVAGEKYLFGRGEDLPLDDASQDVVVFFNSLHHVPVGDQAAALAEARRVLVPAGLLYIQEPIAEGAYFEMVRPIDDETQVRAAALAAIRAAVANGSFVMLAEEEYLAQIRHPSFEAFAANMAAVDAGRRAALERCRASLKESFEAAAEQRDGFYFFDNPARLTLLRKA